MFDVVLGTILVVKFVVIIAVLVEILSVVFDPVIVVVFVEN